MSSNRFIECLKNIIINCLKKNQATLMVHNTIIRHYYIPIYPQEFNYYTKLQRNYYITYNFHFLDHPFSVPFIF